MSRVVVVTGASGGIGRATVAEFARRGDRVALIARGQSGLDAAAAQCQELGLRKKAPVRWRRSASSTTRAPVSGAHDDERRSSCRALATIGEVPLDGRAVPTAA